MVLHAEQHLVPDPQPAPEPNAQQEGLFRVSDAEQERRHRIREALKEEGFAWEIWQKPEKGMIFGLIRVEDDLQTHVRYYKGGYLKAESEIAHKYLEHIVSPRECAKETIEEILERHGIDDVDVHEREIPRHHRGPMPPTRTPWKPVVAGLSVALAGWFYSRKSGWFSRR